MVGSTALLSGISRRLGHGGAKQALTPAYYALLAGLGDPHKKLPPVFHVAGTNGKGSTCAFLRSMLEAEGYKVHVYTSPHLVTFHERIRIAGQLISEDELTALLRECERIDCQGDVSEFEIATAAAFAAFARHPADFVILETGLGGRLDATNIVEKPAATIITRISYDHRDFLGDTLDAIAREKAGIMRKGVPCFIAPQPDTDSRHALKDTAREIGVPVVMGDAEWKVEPAPDGFRFVDYQRDMILPLPALSGVHQCFNAGLAIASLSVLQKPLSHQAIHKGLETVQWPARLEHMEQGALADLLPKGWELWLDGGHNDSAGEVLAAQAKVWRKRDGKPLTVIFAMLNSKTPSEFLAPLVPYISLLRTHTIPDEANSFSAEELLQLTRDAGIRNAAASSDLRKAISDLTASSPAGRVLICGSLYFAGYVLRENGIALV